MRIGEAISYVILGAAILMTIVMVNQRDMENTSLVAVIRAEVKAEMDRRYRNVPRIEVQKVYTLNATGKDVAIETTDSRRNPE